MPTLSPIDDSSAAEPAALEPDQPAAQSFAHLARRVAGRTTDLIAVGLVLVGSLTFGRQAVEWWRAEPEEVVPSSTAQDTLSPWNNAVEIEFGDAPFGLARQTVVGDREFAMTRLVAECRTIAESPASLPLSTSAERELVSRLRPLTPVAQESERWSIYRLEEPFSLVAAVRQSPSPDVEAAPAESRLLCFGMAVPEGELQWTLFLFRSAAGERTDGGIALADIIPRGFRRLLGLRGVKGEFLAGVAGRGEPRTWQGAFDAHLHTRGWRRLRDWSRSDRSWSAEFQRGDGEDPGVLRIVMTSEGNDDWTGLIHQSPQ